MNLRKAKDYTIGLDLGTSSVGWAIVDANGDLYHFKGKPTWGSRLFSEAEKAADRRVKRSQRRRYDRRRQRIDALQNAFAKDMEGVDPEFFVRLNQSRLIPEDRGFRWPLFNDDIVESEYHKDFPTIYHLRKHLCESQEKEDLRLIYLALHNIVKYRGNFLYEDAGKSLTASNANACEAAKELIAAIVEYITEVKTEFISITGEILFKPDETSIQQAIDESSQKRADRRDRLCKAFCAKGKEPTKWINAISGAVLGYKVEYSNVFSGLEKNANTSFPLSNEEGTITFAEEICPDEGRRLFEAIQRAYSSFVLSGVLRGSGSISEAMVLSYEQHHADLTVLKALFRDYLSKKEYNEFFRGTLDSHGKYDINELSKGSYTSYISGEKKANGKGTSHEDLIKRIVKICNAHKEILNDPRYIAISSRIEDEADGNFLAKQKIRANGAIPYQLHLEELSAIIESQGKYYPFLIEHKDLIESLVSSRIPYYVGPLYYGSTPDLRKNAWSKRKPGMEHARVYPWNFEDAIDIDTTAKRFIQRMTGTCSYLFGEPVLPKNSLLYEEFCVLNELNGSRWGSKGSKQHRFDYKDKHRIIEELFKRYASVSYERVRKWLLNEHGVVDAEVTGGQGESGYESKLSTYRDFCKILNVRNLDDAVLSFDEMEEIVLWNTVFEDRSLFRRKLLEKYGPEGDGRLTQEQVRKLVNKRYTGWGRLSRKFLTGVRVNASVPTGTLSIMDVLRDGNPDNHLRQLVLMEVLTDKRLGFQLAIDEQNKTYLESGGNVLSADDMQGSPANRRAVKQALRIVDEIIHIVGREPARICLEVTRDDDLSKKGKRIDSRYAQLLTALKAFDADKAFIKDLKEHKHQLDDDKLLLYFEQQGKCMYTGERLDLTMLSSYHIDHIIPQAYVKDDSLSNRVLVKSVANERKLDSLLLDEKIIQARIGWWRALLNAGLMSRKKYENLTCTRVDDRVGGFIARQLVETSQVIKFVRQMCEQRFPNTEVVSVRANTSHGIRDNLGLIKCRELNDCHHAHDAFLACQVATFVGRCYPKWQDGFSFSLIQKYIKSLNGLALKGRQLGKSGFIADRLTSRQPFVDETTGEILWEGESRSAYISKALGYKDCFISRMTEVQTGAFWDETIYSPRDKKNAKSLSIPLKSSAKAKNTEGYLDPSKYGGVSGVKQAYWFIFAAKNKKGQYKYFFEGVPVYLAKDVSEHLQEYANSLANQAGCGEAIILRKRVPLWQKLELDGVPLYLRGSGGERDKRNSLRSARELYCNNVILETIYQLLQGVDQNAESNLVVYDWLCASATLTNPLLSDMLKLYDKRDSFNKLNNEDQRNQLIGILNILKGKDSTVDLTKIGGAKSAGNLRKNIASILPSITWIDQSVTGMYEMKTTFEDLTSGL